MGWSLGYDRNWKRDVGYGVPAICDDPECTEEIDRGLSYVCGGEPYGGILAGERYTQLVYLDHDDGGFKVERHCKIAGCQRSEEHLDWMLKEQGLAMDEFRHREGEESGR